MLRIQITIYILIHWRAIILWNVEHIWKILPNAQRVKFYCNIHYLLFLIHVRIFLVCASLFTGKVYFCLFLAFVITCTAPAVCLRDMWCWFHVVFISHCPSNYSSDSLITVFSPWKQISAIKIKNSGLVLRYICSF